MPTDLTAQLQRAAALLEGGHSEEAAAVLDELAASPEGGDGRVTDLFVRLELRRGDGRAAVARYDALVARFPSLAADPLALLAGGAAAHYAGAHEVAAERYRRAVEAVRGKGWMELEARALLGLAVTESALGHNTRSIAVGKEALAVARAASLRSLEGAVLYNLADFHRTAARYGEALQVAERAVEHFARAGSRVWRLRSRLRLAELCVVSGDEERGLALAAEGYAEAVAQGDGILAIYAACVETGMHIEFGRLAEARAALERAYRIKADPGLGDVVRSVYRVWLAVEAGDPGVRSEAEAALRDPARARWRAPFAFFAALGALKEGADGEEVAASLRRAALEADSAGDFETEWRCHAALGALHASRAGLADNAHAAEDARASIHHHAAARALIERVAASLEGELRAKYLATPTRKKGLEEARKIAALSDGAGTPYPLPPPGASNAVTLARALPLARTPAALKAALLDAFLDFTGATRALLWLPGEPDLEGSLVHGRAVGMGDVAVPHPGPIALPVVAALADEVYLAHALPPGTGEGFLCGGSAICLPVPWTDGERGFLYADHPREAGVFSPVRVDMWRAFAALGALSLQNLELLTRARADRDRVAEQQARIEELTARLEETLARREAHLADALARLDKQQSGTPRQKLVGASGAMKRLFALLDRLRGSEVAVLVTGESGTGKELVARTIHDESNRSSGPFLAVNCAAVSEGVLESELFGHVRGAFTGADLTRPGLIVAAEGGTLFLDEVGDTPPAMQAKLLRVLQDGEIRAVGAERARRVDVRFLAATHRDLEAAVKEGRFRADLYYRLNVVSVQVPPLRERLEDIALLVAHLVARRKTPLSLTPDGLELLQRYEWPGNVRELAAAVETAALYVQDGKLDADALLRKPELMRLVQGPATARRAERDVPLKLSELSAWALKEALSRSGGNRTEAARALGIGRATLYRRLKELGMT